MSNSYNLVFKNSSTIKLPKSNSALVIVVSLSAFLTYSCMYGFRKPYTATTYSNIYFLGISYKVCLVIAQVIGYMCSKFYGIKFIASINPSKRAFYILLFIFLAWVSLLLFALIPPPYNIICMFLNGLPLGMVFGLVFGYLEGRRTTELMGAILATSFIFASGLAKTIGKWLSVDFNISTWWMPFTAGSIFILPLLLSVWLLNKTPPPTELDIAHRTARNPMTKQERKNFIQQFGKAIVPVVLGYMLFTIVRDFCEDFANELWTETGYQNTAGIFAKASTLVSMIVLFVIGGFFLIGNNYKAFRLSHFIIMGGILLSAIATLIFNYHFITAFAWMILATTGMYLAYIPFNCLYFERMLATYKVKGNIGFVMYIADAFAYLGTVLVLLIKEFIPLQYNWVSFFSFLFYSVAMLGIILVLISLNIHHKLNKRLCNPNQPL